MMSSIEAEISAALSCFVENLRSMTDRQLEFRMLTVTRRAWEEFQKAKLNGSRPDRFLAEKAGMRLIMDEMERRLKGGK